MHRGAIGVVKWIYICLHEPMFAHKCFSSGLSVRLTAVLKIVGSTKTILLNKYNH